MYIEEATTIASIKELHLEVFHDELDDQLIEHRLEKGEMKALVLKNNVESEVILGYAIVQDRNNCCHIWLMGIHPNHQGQGNGAAFLKEIEVYAKTHTYKKITLSTFNHRRIMLAISIKNNFKITKTEEGTYGDKIKIRLEKVLAKKRELRLLITNKCNFKCIFCHSEGLDAKESFKNSTAGEITAMLKEAVKIGYDDITFSGGEPLIEKEKLLAVIASLSNFTQPPDLTIVTNAYYLDEAVVEQLSQYPGFLKLNISLHSLTESKFDHITAVADKFALVYRNIKNATKKGLKIKLNCVVMNGLNDEEKDYLNYLKEATKLGVFAVKFLELLVLEENQDLFKYFVSNKNIISTLKRVGCHTVNKTERMEYFDHNKYNTLQIEAARLTCKIGCASCMKVRDRTLGPNLNYFPCFIHSEKPIVIDKPEELENSFLEGEQFISKFAEKYGDDSPILIKEDKFVKDRSDAFFALKGKMSDIEGKLIEHGFELRKKQTYFLNYVRPERANKKWTTGECSLKFGYDKHSKHNVQFIYATFHSEVIGEYTCWNQQFLEGSAPPSCGSLEEAERIMHALSFESYMQTDFELSTYRLSELEVSLDCSGHGSSLKINSRALNDPRINKLLSELKAENIRQPYDLWLESQICRN